MVKIKYNCDRTLDSFTEAIDLIRSHGFNPIGVGQMCLEDTFVFETEEEAKKAYNKLERDENEKMVGIMAGWWYGREDFLKAVEEYENTSDFGKVRYYWL